LPEGADPEAPELRAPVAPLPTSRAKEPTEEPSEGRRVFAVVGWGGVVVLLTWGALVAGQLTFLPGARPALTLFAASHGVALGLGLAAGVVTCLACGALGGPLFARLGGATLFGLCTGLTIPLAEHVFRADALPLELPPEGKVEPRGADAPRSPGVLELDDVPVAPSPNTKHETRNTREPKIAAPKPAGGCPGCGRVIPGDAGSRYCMLCDRTF
jgi:hypothetical protein